jgi:hypothetical protein
VTKLLQVGHKSEDGKYKYAEIKRWSKTVHGEFIGQSISDVLVMRAQKKLIFSLFYL